MMSEPATDLLMENMTDEEYKQYLPKPAGYRILVMMPDIEETYGDSGIVKSAKAIQHDQILSMTGLVVDMGPQAYKDPERFPQGPWCEEGNYVMFRMNSGTRFRVGGKEFRLMNDDTIEAVVPDPRGIQRV